MRRPVGLAFILLGLVGLMMCGIVLFRLPLPLPGFLFRYVGVFGIHIDPLVTPLSSAVLLLFGSFLLRQPKSAPNS